MDQRLPIDQKASLLMLVLCSVWAMQQVLLKATTPDFSPTLQLALRSGIGGALVMLFVLLRGQRFDLNNGTLLPGLAAGFLFSFEFFLVSISVQLTSAAHLVVFLYTAPIFAALGLAYFIPNERLKKLQWFGIALAFVGIAIAFGGGADQKSMSDIILGDLLALLAGASWGATTVVVRATKLSQAPATQTLLYQLIACFVLLLGVAWATGDMRFNPTPLVLGSLFFQAVIVSFISFLVWFWLLKTYLASRLGVFSFLTPLLGVVLSSILLDEQISERFIGGALLVVSGITLVSAHSFIIQLVQGSKKEAEG